MNPPKTTSATWRRDELLLEKVADTLFLIAITGMVASGFMMVYNVL